MLCCFNLFKVNVFLWNLQPIRTLILISSYDIKFSSFKWKENWILYWTEMEVIKSTKIFIWNIYCVQKKSIHLCTSILITKQEIHSHPLKVFLFFWRNSNSINIHGFKILFQSGDANEWDVENWRLMRKSW